MTHPDILKRIKLDRDTPDSGEISTNSLFRPASLIVTLPNFKLSISDFKKLFFISFTFAGFCLSWNIGKSHINCAAFLFIEYFILVSSSQLHSEPSEISLCIGPRGTLRSRLRIWGVQYLCRYLITMKRLPSLQPFDTGTRPN